MRECVDLIEVIEVRMYWFVSVFRLPDRFVKFFCFYFYYIKNFFKIIVSLPACQFL